MKQKMILSLRKLCDLLTCPSICWAAKFFKITM